MAIFFTLLKIQAQVRNATPDSLSRRIIKNVDSAAWKFNSAGDKINTYIQQTQHKIDQQLKGDFKNNSTEADSAELNRTKGSDEIKRQAQIAEHKFDSINQIQKKDRTKYFSVIDSTQGKISNGVGKIEAKSVSTQHKVDSLSQKMTDGIHTKLSIVDSAQHKIDRAESKIQQRQKRYTDSLHLVMQKYEQKLQVEKLTHAMDSLKSKAQPFDSYKNKLDSINHINPLQKTQGEIAHAQSKIQNLTNGPKSKIDEKLNLLSKESGGRGNVPGGVDVPNTDMQALTGKIENNVKLPDADINLNQKLAGIDQPSMKNPQLPTNKGLDTKLDISKDLDKTIDLNKLDDLKKGTGDVTNASDKIAGYTDDIKNIEKDDLEKVTTLKEDAVAKLPVNDELNEIQKQDKALKEQQAKLESFKNPEEYKKQTLARSQEMVTKQMAIYQKQIQESVDRLSKYQSKMGTVLSHSKDLPKKRDMLQKLKMREKFVPGITLQIQKPSAWLVDFNPSLRYRLTSYWSVGLGWNERVLFGKYQSTYEQVRIYGPRSFTEVVIFKGFSARLDAEDMSTFIVPDQQAQDVGKRIWIWSYMAGIKKEFSFIPKVIGNVQFMYNVFSSYSDNAYPTRFNVRFGFEYFLKKNNKKAK